MPNATPHAPSIDQQKKRLLLALIGLAAAMVSSNCVLGVVNFNGARVWHHAIECLALSGLIFGAAVTLRNWTINSSTQPATANAMRTLRANADVQVFLAGSAILMFILVYYCGNENWSACAPATVFSGLLLGSVALKCGFGLARAKQ